MVWTLTVIYFLMIEDVQTTRLVEMPVDSKATCERMAAEFRTIPTTRRAHCSQLKAVQP